jgi:hypothetical protein
LAYGLRPALRARGIYKLQVEVVEIAITAKQVNLATASRQLAPGFQRAVKALIA